MKQVLGNSLPIGVNKERSFQGLPTRLTPQSFPFPLASPVSWPHANVSVFLFPAAVEGTDVHFSSPTPICEEIFTGFSFQLPPFTVWLSLNPGET